MLTLPLLIASLFVVPAPKAPNIIVINADDLGYGDLGCYGAKNIKTPNIDKLARDGVRFTNFYVAQPVCSASRTALLTGCYPNRLGIHGALGPASRIGIHDNELTLAELCKSKNYATAIVGKWHLGHHNQFLPTRHGFDSYLGLPYSNDMWPFHPEAKKGTYPPLPLIDGEKIINPDVTPEAQAKLTTQYTERAVQFIEKHKAEPFFLYFAHSMPHVPLFVSEKARGKSQQGLYGDVIQEIDWSVGEILATVLKHKLEENTLVIFTSDNGPWLSYGNHAGSAGPLREGKGTVWEGGVRVPFLARWPGVIPANSTCHEAAMTIDLLPTIAKFIGAELPKHPIDGLEITALLQGIASAKSPHESLCFYYHTNELQAIRSGKWKLMLPHSYRTMEKQTMGKDGTPGRYRQVKIEQPQLFDLNEDLGETRDLASQHPEVIKQLMLQVERARVELGDSLTKRTGKGLRTVGKVNPN
jgi:arylsulfatase A